MASTNANNAQSQDKSTETFITAFVLHAAIAGAEFLAFWVVKNHFPRIYQPRSDIPPEKERTQPLPRNLFQVILSILKANDEEIISKNGLDAYLFVRFLRLMVLVFGPIAFLSWSVLLPVYGTSSAGGTGLDRFTFGNVGRDQQARLAAPLILVWLSTLYIVYLIKREFDVLVEKRRTFLTSRAWATKVQSRTVLVTGIPKEYLSVEALQDLTKDIPGGVRKIWLARDVKDLNDVYERRNDAVKKLESADNKVIKLANKRVRKNKVDVNGSEDLGASEKMHETPVLAKYIPEKKRPTHRLGKIPFFGKKVDTISWTTEEIEKTESELERERQDVSKFETRSSAFILFNNQISAHIFAQSLKGDSPLRRGGRHLNVAPDDVVWNNLNVNAYSAKARRAAVLAVISAFIIFFTPLTAFVTSISNVSNLCSTVSWLGWLCTLPTPINGIIQGVLPPLVLLILWMLVPIIFRKLTILQGKPLYTTVEHSLQKRYFAFLFVQGFIVATLSSGIMAGISQITSDPSSTVSLLAENLPKSSTFFLTLIVTSGLSGAAGGFLQIARLAISYVKIILLGGSPRSIHAIINTMPFSQWGVIFPSQSLTVVIAVSFSTIAPLVCGFAAMSFSLWYFCYKYLMLWVMDQPDRLETAGAFYHTALNQIFAGLYIEHLCLIGLFFLSRNSNGGLSTIPEGVLTVVLLVLTIAAQILLKARYRKHLTYLPASMADEMNRNEQLYAQQMQQEKGASRLPRAASGTHLGANERPHDDAMTRFQSNNTTIAAPYGEKSPKQSQSIDGRHYGIPEHGDLEAAATAESGGPQHKLGERGHSGLNLDGTAGGMEELEGGLNERTFYHPALWKHQPTIWLVRDDVGISDEAIKNARAHGIDATNEDARFNEKGKIEILREDLPGNDFDQN